ncbi:UNVERIFIED_CONTAM: hypothetical protein Sangu_2817400 [Sesamum angustifolium]|uniref:Uncharacterized protein n=1 Tax=Sesamum angustifolium TaxID=2727405 RepID=A0AAW2IRJ5_9LAMI
MELGWCCCFWAGTVLDRLGLLGLGWHSCWARTMGRSHWASGLLSHWAARKSGPRLLFKNGPRLVWVDALVWTDDLAFGAIGLEDELTRGGPGGWAYLGSLSLG